MAYDVKDIFDAIDEVFKYIIEGDGEKAVNMYVTCFLKALTDSANTHVSEDAVERARKQFGNVDNLVMKIHRTSKRFSEIPKINPMGKTIEDYFNSIVFPSLKNEILLSLI